MPIAEHDIKLISMYQKKFRCINKEDMYVNGDFDSAQARLISMRLNRCVNTDTLTCKSEEEITQFFRDKLLLVIHNERRFDSNMY